MRRLDKHIGETRASLWGYALIFLWCFYNLSPLLTTGLIGDDAYNSQLRGAVIQMNISIWERYMREVLGWITGAGRVFPGSFYTYPFYYYYVGDPFFIKIIGVNIISISVVLFSLLVKRQSGSLRDGLIVVSIVPLLFQFRMWHDPILSFTFLIPILFLYCVISLLCFQSYLNTFKRRYLIIASALYLLAGVTYEVSYFLSILFFTIAYSKERKVKTAIIQSSPFLALSILGVLSHFILIMVFVGDNVNTYPTKVSHIQLSEAVNAFFIQFTAALPLIYKSRIYFADSNFNLITHWYDWIIICFYSCLVYFILLKTTFGSFRERDIYVVIFGALLALAPAFVVAVSGHQTELISAGYGFAYIPIYIQYFGIAVLILGVAKAIPIYNHKWLKVFSVLSTMLFIFVAIVNVSNNRAVAENTNIFYKYPRVLLETALKGGLLDRVGEKPLIIRNYRYPMDNSWNYTKLTGNVYDMCRFTINENNRNCTQKFLDISNVEATHSPIQAYDVENKNIWGISYRVDTNGGDNGIVFLGKFKSIVYDHKSDRFLTYVLSDLFAFNHKEGDIKKYEVSEPLDFLRIVNEERVPKLDHTPIDLDQYRLDYIEYHWSGHIHPLDGDSKQSLRWASGDVNLSLYNFTETVLDVELNMIIANPSNKDSEFEVSYPGEVDSFILNAGNKEIIKKLRLAPGITTIKIHSDGEIIDNGDPRKIKFGIANFGIKLDHI